MTTRNPSPQSEQPVGAQPGESAPTALTALTGQSEQWEQWERTPRAMHPLASDHYWRLVLLTAAEAFERDAQEAERARAADSGAVCPAVTS